VGDNHLGANRECARTCRRFLARMIPALDLLAAAAGAQLERC
jgi:hypothetical protein